MLFDRRNRYDLMQALLRARNREYGGNLLENIAQTGIASGDGSYGEPAFGGMRTPSTSQPEMTTGGKAASQSRKFIPTRLPHPFRDLARFSYTGEVADTAKARGFPAHDQLAFNEASRTSSRLANPRSTYGRPLPINAAATFQPRYLEYLWESLFPPYCTPTDDNPTFPPLVNQLTEADKDHCHEQFEHDNKQCHENHSYNPWALRGCLSRAETIRDLCLRGEREVRPWSDVDEDGIRFPKPPNRWKKRK